MLTPVLLAALLASPMLPQPALQSGECTSPFIPSVVNCVWCIVTMQPACLTPLPPLPREAA